MWTDQPEPTASWDVNAAFTELLEASTGEIRTTMDGRNREVCVTSGSWDAQDVSDGWVIQ